MLWDEARVERWDGKTDVGFRMEGNNFVWEKAGVTYTSPGRPGSDPHVLLSLMDACGVDMLVLQPPLQFNRFCARMAQAYPGRFIPLAVIDESEYATAKGIQQLHTVVDALKVKGLYHNAYPGWECYKNFEHPRYTPFYKEVASLGIPIWFLGNADEEDYPGILHKIRVWQDAVPGIPCIKVHGFPPSVYLQNDRVVIPDLLKEIVRQGNFYMEVMPQAMRYYTHPKADDIMHALYDEFGATKFIWGSEFIKSAFPHTKEHYAEMQGYFASVCTYMSKDDVALILGENLRRIFRLPQ
jgi:predicted TIM-barrel fold metal-dependent hydrolase